MCYSAISTLYTIHPCPSNYSSDLFLTQWPLCVSAGVSSRFPEIMAAGTHSPGGPSGIIRSQSFAGFSTLQERRSRCAFISSLSKTLTFPKLFFLFLHIKGCGGHCIGTNKMPVEIFQLVKILKLLFRSQLNPSSFKSGVTFSYQMAKWRCCGSLKFKKITSWSENDNLWVIYMHFVIGY